MKILVAISGGVDSSMCAKLLQDAGRVQVTPKAIWRAAAWALRHGPVGLSRLVASKVRSGHDRQGAR
ncbi:hypothetical protein [uncultured Campylobacter sp.]|uniref:hypothetical protein n=1 Tax=uncultured Campylobacter sp. TaxID=218934 RepID=UPI00261C7F4A|nr:hypothetical protein [uncultured Campylobacter sp.]